MSATSLDSGVLKRPSRAEAWSLAEAQNAALVAELRALNHEDWNAPTDCEGWRVKDIAAHLLGWAEFFTSASEFRHQLRALVPGRRQLPTTTDVQNELQVNDRSSLSPQELLSGLENAMPRFLSFRTRATRMAGIVPFYAGIIGPATVGFLMATVFTRDVFMHRIDIARATARELAVGESERRLVADVVRDWGRRSKADARLVLTGDAGGDFVLGSGSQARISGDPLDFCRILTSRADPGVMIVTGDTDAATSWLRIKVVF